MLRCTSDRFRPLAMVSLLTSLWFSGCAAPLTAEAALLPNGDFQQGLSGWVLRGESSAYGVVEGAQAWRRGRSGAIILNEQSEAQHRQAAYFARRDLPTQPGYYVLEFALRTELTSGSAGAQVIVRGQDRQQKALAIPGEKGVVKVTGSTPWQLYRVVYQITEPATETVLQLQVTGGLGQVGFDDISIRKLTDRQGQQAMAQQNPQAPRAVDRGAVSLGEPCRIVNARKGMLYRDTVSGRNLLVINSCTPGVGSFGSAVLVDYLSDQRRVVPFPAGSGGWDMIPIAPNVLLFESLAPLHLIPVNVHDAAVDHAGIIPVGFGNQYAWRLGVGPDGYVYFGSYPTCHVYRVKPGEKSVEDLGKMGSKDNLYARHVAVTGDGWLIVSVGTENQGTVAYHIASGEQRDLEGATPSAVYSIGGEVYGNVFLGLDENNKPKRRLAKFNSQSVRFEELPTPAPSGLYWSTVLPGSDANRLVLTASNGVYYLLTEAEAPRAIWNLPLRGGELVGIDEDDNIVGFRGQDYFVARPMASSIEPRPMAEHPSPVAMHFLRADPRGGVTGGPSFGQTLFRFDAKRKLHENTPQVVDGGGEVYDGQWIDGKFYFAAYGGGDLAVWNPDQPWDQWNGANPRPLAKYNGEDHGGFIRPQGGLVVGPGGRLFAGWSSRYGTTKGGLSEYDLATGESRHWMMDDVLMDSSCGKITADDRYIYGVTSNRFNGLRPTARDIVFWVFDPQSEKFVHQQTLANHTGYSAVVRVPATGHIWVTAPAGLMRFDPQTLVFAETLTWPRDAAASPANIHESDALDDRAWFAAGGSVVRLDDGAKPKLVTLFATDLPVGAVAAGLDGKLYFTQGVSLWSAPLRP